MKKLIVLLLAVVLLLTACSSTKFPMTSQHEKYGRKVAQRLLGHAQISTTLDIYTHVRDEAVKDAAARMNASF